MTADDLALVVRGVAPVLREFVEAQTKPLKDQIADLERRLVVAEALKVAPAVDLDALALKAAELIDKPKDGRDGKDGENGRSVTYEEVAPLIMAEIEKAVKDIPVPKDGQDGAPGRDGVDGKDGSPGPAGADGKDGEPGPAGPIGLTGEKGLDGTNGRDGRDGQPGVPGLIGEKGLDGKDGAPGQPGKDGRDGTLEHLKAEHDGERTVTLCFKNGDPIEGGVIRFPVPIHRGLFQDGKTYEPADMVTWGGSTWMAKEATSEQPGITEGSSRAWMLCVKKGRDGKEGKAGPEGKPGPRGEKGTDGRNGY